MSLCPKKVAQIYHSICSHLSEEKKGIYITHALITKVSKRKHRLWLASSVKSKHYCEIQRPYNLNMRIDASDEDRAS